MLDVLVDMVATLNRRIIELDLASPGASTDEPRTVSAAAVR
jgi:hypothetical protein